MKDILKEKFRGEFHQAGLLLARQCTGSPGTWNPEENGLPRLPVSWSPTLFSGSDPFGLPPLTYTEKTIECRHFSTHAEVIAAAETWLDGQPSEFCLSSLQKLHQGAKKCVYVCMYVWMYEYICVYIYIYIYTPVPTSKPDGQVQDFRIFYSLVCLCVYLFVFGATAPSGLWPPHSSYFGITQNDAYFGITQNDASQSVGILWASDQLVAETSTWQHTTLTTDKHSCPGGIRTHNLIRRAAADLCIRPRGHWDRHFISFNKHNIKVPWRWCRNAETCRRICSIMQCCNINIYIYMNLLVQINNKQ